MNPLALFYMAQFEADKNIREEVAAEVAAEGSPLLEQHVKRHRK